MTAYEYTQIILQVQKELPLPRFDDEAAAHEVAQLLSGSLICPLYDALWVRNFEMDAATQHLESLYDSENHFGLIYFVFLLAETADVIVPFQFAEMSANESLVPILSAALIEDWIAYDAVGAAHESKEYAQ